MAHILRSRIPRRRIVLVLGAVRLEVTVNLGRREDEDLVIRCRRSAGATAALVVRHLRDGLRLGPELGRQERPEVTGVQAGAELRGPPTADIGLCVVPDVFVWDIVGRLKRQPRLAATVGEVVMVDTDDAVSGHRGVSTANLS